MPLPAEVRPLLRRLEIVSRRQLAGSLAGEYRTAFRGQGLEFAELRPYEAGDDPRHIDWRVTARTGAPHVRRYREERSRTLLLLADLSASCTPAKRHLQLEAAALLAFAAAATRDRVALVAFSDRVEHLLAPAAGRNHVLRLLTDLLTLRPAGTKTDLRPPLEAALALGRRPGMAILLSDFHAPLPEPLLRRVAARHDLLALVLRDAAENRLPTGGLLLCRDLESGAERLLDLSAGHAADALAQGWRETDRQLAAALGRAGVDHAFLASDASPLPPLRTLFARRRRQR
jgi:uncharacterized protein (DUF58 family)